MKIKLSIFALLATAGVASSATVTFGPSLYLPSANPAGPIVTSGSTLIVANGTDILSDITLSWTITAIDNITSAPLVVTSDDAVGIGASAAADVATGIQDALQSNETISFSFTVAAAGGAPAVVDVLSVSIGRGGLLSIDGGTPFANSTQLQPGISNGFNATVTNTGNSRINSVSLDLTSGVAVPEPTSAALLGLGAFAFLVRRRK
jgi:hypothetical protein